VEAGNEETQILSRVVATAMLLINTLPVAGELLSCPEFSWPGSSSSFSRPSNVDTHSQLVQVYVRMSSCHHQMFQHRFQKLLVKLNVNRIGKKIKYYKAHKPNISKNTFKNIYD